MSKTIKRLKKLLEKEFEKEKKKISEEAALTIKENMDKYFDDALALIQSGDITFFEQIDEAAMDMAAKMHKKFVMEKAKENPEIGKIKLLIVTLEEDLFFDEFEFLEKYLTKFEFMPQEKVEIYAYYFNSTIKFIMNFDISAHEQTIKDYVNKKVDVNNISWNLFRKLACKHIEKNIVDDIVGRKKDWGHFRNIINENGEILPFSNATKMMAVFDDDFSSLSYIKMILEESEKKWRETEAKKICEITNAKEKAEIQKKKIEDEKKKLEDQKKKLEDQKTNFEERRLAISQLSEYLLEDYPIKYILEEEIQIVIDLLEKAGYKLEKINEIKRNIIYNNQKILIEKLMANYLTEDQIKTINDASNIINDLEAIKNPILEQIIKDYNFVVELLLSLSYEKTEVTETMEFIIITIEDIKNNLTNYNYSDYRRVLKQA